MFATLSVADTAAEKRLDDLLRRALTSNAAEYDSLSRAFDITLATARSRLDALTVALYRAEWLRVRGQRSLTMDSSTSQPTTTDARKCLLKAIDQYAQIIDTAEARIDAIERRHPDAEKNDRWKTTSAIISRAQYSMAWAYISAGDTAIDDSERQRHLQRAVEIFASFTQDIDWKQPLVIDCLIGRTMAMVELGQYREALKLLETATADRVDRATLLRITSVRMKAHHGLNDDAQAARDAEAYFAATDVQHVDDAGAGEKLLRLNWAVAMAKDIARHPITTSDDARRKSLLDITARVASYGPQWTNRLRQAMPNDFAMAELNAWQQSSNALRRGQWAEAQRLAEEALTSRSPLPDAIRSDLRYTAAIAAFAMKRWDTAFAHGQTFLSPAENLRAALTTRNDDPRVATIRENTLVAAVNGATPPGTVSPKVAMAFLDRIQNDSPTLQSPRGQWYRGWLLLADNQPQQAIDQLKAIAPQSDVYACAQFGLARAWQALAMQRSSGKQKNERLKCAAEAITRYASFPNKPSRAMTCAIIDTAVNVAEQMVAIDAIDGASLTAFVQGVAKLSAEMSYRQNDLTQWVCCVNVYNAKPAEAMAELDRLSMTDPALFETVAATCERRYLTTTTNDAHKAAFGDFAIQCLRKAAALAGSKKHAFALRLRLAEQLMHQGKYSDAEDEYRAMLATASAGERATAMRGLALACERQKKWLNAIEPWRTLASSLPIASDAWYEANYHLIVTLQHAQRKESALATLKLVRLRVGGTMDARWENSFSDLETKLNTP